MEKIMQLELFFTAYDYYGTMNKNKFPRADEDHDGTPFNDKGYMYCCNYATKVWNELHEEI